MKIELYIKLVLFWLLSCALTGSAQEIPHSGMRLPEKVTIWPEPDTYEHLKERMKEELKKSSTTEILKIKSSTIQYLPGNTIKKFKKIESLSLDMPSLKVLPKELGQLKKLEILTLRCSGSLLFPDHLKKVKGLRLTLICTDSSETISLTKIKNYKHLEGLEINSILFQSFPEWICSIQSLEYLNLEKCNLKNIPASIGELRSMMGLYFNNNMLDSLPKEFKELDSLIYIGLSHNNFTEFPEVLLQMEGLHSINLEGNKIMTIPDEIGQLKQLFTLDLTGNPVSSEELERIRKLLPNVRVYF